MCGVASMRWLLGVAAAVGLASPWAAGQGLAGDLLAGKLVDPEVGQWAWYDLTDARGRAKYAVRQAIVGEERVGLRKGYWVEFEVVPELGYRSIYKMLLTGPASDPGNIHRIIRKIGFDPPEELPTGNARGAERETKPEERESLGMEGVATQSGTIEAEHVRFQRAGQTIDLWLNEAVLPTGIVQMRTRDGEMRLRTYGVGGIDGTSAINRGAPPGDGDGATPPEGRAGEGSPAPDAGGQGPPPGAPRGRNSR